MESQQVSKLSSPAFSNNWFRTNTKLTQQLMIDQQPKSVLEIGAFEGQFTCFALANFSQLTDYFVIDTFEGSGEHTEKQSSGLRQRFEANVASQQAAIDRIDFRVMKGYSQELLPRMRSSQQDGLTPDFDLIYVDASHEGKDVLLDLVLAYQLCAVGGLIVCDDYQWQGHKKAPKLAGSWSPKPAIDAFFHLYGTNDARNQPAFQSDIQLSVELVHKGRQFVVRKLA